MDHKLLDSPLNQAHSFARIAESCERTFKFEEARKCHQKAVEYLEESAKIATFLSNQESINLQIEFHQRQQEVLSLKILQYAVQNKIYEQNQKLIMQMEQQIEVNGAKTKDGTLRWAIYKNIEAADSLIDTLAVRDSSKVEDESEEVVTSTAVYNNGVKHPKSESTVIEELHTLNSKLRELISQLLIQLEESRRETEILRVKVQHYESLAEQEKENKKETGDHNLIDLSSSGESIGIMP